MKILILGNVASGKTTLAKQLSQKHKMNYYEIDSIVHDDNNGGKKRSIEEQNKIIKEINKSDNWIIEGILRENLYYLLEMVDKIIYLDVSKITIYYRILKRYIKQKLKIEKANYKVNINMLINMYNWANKYEKNKKNLKKLLERYKENKLNYVKKQ